MKQQASKKEKLEANSSLFFGMGMIIALSFLLAAFEWSSPRKSLDMFAAHTGMLEVIELDLTVKVPEPPKPKMEEPTMLSPEEIVATDEKVNTPDIVSPEDWAEKPVFVMPTLPEPPGGRGTDEDETVFDFAEIAPSFEGGTSALMQFLASAVRYPQVDIEQGVEGRVICTFVVEKDGSITDIHVVRGVSPGIDKEAKRVIASMPHWKPGFQNGNPVRVKFTLPIVFRLSK